MNSSSCPNPGVHSRQYSSIALDSFDYPHISYTISSGNSVGYANWDGANWNLWVVDESGYYPSMAVASTNIPHISYGVTGINEVRYAFWKTGSP